MRTESKINKIKIKYFEKKKKKGFVIAYITKKDMLEPWEFGLWRQYEAGQKNMEYTFILFILFFLKRVQLTSKTSKNIQED